MDFRPIHTAPIPVYFKLQEILTKKIESGHWKPGESIPSERILSNEHGVSVGTVKKAIMNLVHRGYLYRIQGKGTFVGGTTLRRESLRYYRMMRDFGDVEDSLRIHFSGISLVESSDTAATHLNVAHHEPLFKLRRIFYSAERPVIWSMSFLPKCLFSDLDAQPASLFECGTLYETLEKQYGLPCVYNHELFGVQRADDELTENLSVPAGTPLLSIEMISYTYKNTPYEYRISYCITDERRVFRTIG
jgi:GntR family transcriptional regulator